MNILALDLAKQVGHARWQASAITSGTRSFAPLRGQGTEALFGKWDTWIKAEIREQEIEFVAYELIDWSIKSPAWRGMYLGMTAIIRAACWNKGIKARGYSVRDIKVAATGKAKADKADMIRTARLVWPDQRIIDDNQADALWVLYVAMASLDMPVKKHAEMLF